VHRIRIDRGGNDRDQPVGENRVGNGSMAGSISKPLHGISLERLPVLLTRSMQRGLKCGYDEHAIVANSIMALRGSKEDGEPNDSAA
jgi:hypothetical protein